ncbi:MAG: DUF2272 domain-containing protein, partial [Dongiaceae bacterium]
QRIGLILLVVLLTACVARREPAVPFDGPAAWRRTIEITTAEWRRFGQQVVYFRYGDDGGETRIIDPVRLWEDDRKAYQPLLDYWAVVGEDKATFQSWRGCQGDWAQKCPWQLPWSAAFISYIMVAAGIPDSEFRPDAEHWDYVRYLISRSKNPGAVFQPELVDRYGPGPGDLICKTRAGTAPPSAEDLVANPTRFGGSLPMHCDFVVANGGDIIEAIGGNVLNSVSKSMIPARDGRLIGGRAGKWFIILRNKFGQAAP